MAEKTTKVWIGTIRLALILDSDSEASDYVSELLRPLERRMDPQGTAPLLDWLYVTGNTGWVGRDVDAEFLRYYEEGSIFTDEQYRDVRGYYLVTVFGDVEPQVQSRHATFEGLVQAGRAYRQKEGEDGGGVYYLTFSPDDEPELNAFSGVSLSEESESVVETPPEPAKVEPNPPPTEKTQLKPTLPPYVDSLPGDFQLDLEESIAAAIFNSKTNADEETCAALGRDILHRIVAKLRPDLLVSEAEANVDPVGRQHGLLCPICRRGDGLSVVAKVTVDLVEDGTEPSETDRDQEWDIASSCRCRQCEWFGTVGQAMDAYTAVVEPQSADPTLVIVMEGGFLQGVYSDYPESIRRKLWDVVVVDYDTEDLDADEIQQIEQRDGTKVDAKVWSATVEQLDMPLPVPKEP